MSAPCWLRSRRSAAISTGSLHPDLCNEMVIWDGQKTSAVCLSGNAARSACTDGADLRCVRMMAARPASATATSPATISSSRRCVGDGRFRQRARRTIAHKLIHPHAGADRACRRRSSAVQAGSPTGPALSAWCMPGRAGRGRIGAAGAVPLRHRDQCGMARARTEATVRSLWHSCRGSAASSEGLRPLRNAYVAPQIVRP